MTLPDEFVAKLGKRQPSCLGRLLKIRAKIQQSTLMKQIINQNKTIIGMCNDTHKKK